MSCVVKPSRKKIRSLDILEALYNKNISRAKPVSCYECH